MPGGSWVDRACAVTRKKTCAGRGAAVAPPWKPLHDATNFWLSTHPARHLSARRFYIVPGILLLIPPARRAGPRLGILAMAVSAHAAWRWRFAGGVADLLPRFPICEFRVPRTYRLFRGLLAYIDTPPTGRSRPYPNQFSSGLEGGQFMKPFVGWYTFRTRCM